MEFHEYVAGTTRARRYRDAQKAFRFRVYLGLEAYVVASLALGLAWAVSKSGAVPSLVHVNLGLSLGAVVVHYGSVSMMNVGPRVRGRRGSRGVAGGRAVP